MSNTFIIVTNGVLENADKLRQLIREGYPLVCADGAADSLKAFNILPDVLIGDLDSIAPATLKDMEQKGVQVEKWPPEKDYTDTELALLYCSQRKAKQVFLFGSVGSRLDHSLANVFLTVRAQKLGIRLYLVTNTSIITMVDKELFLEGKPGDLLSLLPITNQVTGATLKGFKYPLENATIELGSTLGISNEFLTTETSIAVKSGYLLAIHTSC